jgi:hypothetical protein
MNNNIYEQAFENIWKVKTLSKNYKEKDKQRYYEMFLDGAGFILIGYKLSEEGEKINGERK